MNNQTLINGCWADTVQASDRGLAYGQGVFETVLVRAGRRQFWPAHLARLLDGCRRLHIPTDGLEFALEADWSLCQFVDGVLKITLTRGAGGRGYAVSGNLMPTRIVQCYSLPGWPDDPAANGIQARWCETRLARQPLLAGIKHLNRLEQVLARAEWHDPNIREGLLCDTADYVIEGTMSNLFFVRHGRLCTPDLSQSGVCGIVRDWLLRTAPRIGLEVEVGTYTRPEVAAADELFVCNSLIDLWPVIRLGTQVFEIGQVTRQLQALLEEEYQRC